LANLVPGYEPSESAVSIPVERPFDAWAIVERSGERLFVHIPPKGMRAGQWGLLGFTTFWLGFVTFWTAGALGMFGGQNHNVAQVGSGHIAFAAFSTPFWLAGFGMLGGVIWASRGSRTAFFNASWFVTELRCLFWRKRRKIDRSNVQYAREGVYPIRNNNQNTTHESFKVEVVYEKGSFALPCDTPSERAWLIAEINSYLKAVPYSSPRGMDWSDELGDWRRESGRGTDRL
jgi:hypothetical protein